MKKREVVAAGAGLPIPGGDGGLLFSTVPPVLLVDLLPMARWR